MAHSSSKANEPTLVTATFRDPDHAKRAYKSIIDHKGYSDDDVNVLMSDETRDRHFASEGHVEVEEGSKAGKGAGMGAATGGTLGGLAGALLAAGGAVTLPGIGLVIAGPLAAALAGAGGGGAAGTLVGALVGAGIPEKRAKKYESDIKEGGIVLGVRPQNAEDERHFRDEWKRHQGERIHAGDGTTSGTGPMEGYTSRYADYKDDFRRHHSETYGSDTDYTAYEPAYRFGYEVAGEDRYRNRSYDEIEGELRGRYEERHPDSTWNRVKRAVEHAFRRERTRRGHYRHFRETFDTDDDYSTYDPAYRFGYTSAHDKRYRDRDFADVEDELRGRYKERHPDSSWDKVKRAVKHAFQRRRRRST